MTSNFTISPVKYARTWSTLPARTTRREIEAKVVYSILQKQPKRADIYWFVHVDVMDEPYMMEYKVVELIKGNIVRVDFRLGFRVEPRINLMFRKIGRDMVKTSKSTLPNSVNESLGRKNLIGDFRFVVMERFLEPRNDLPFYEKRSSRHLLLLQTRLALEKKRAFRARYQFCHHRKSSDGCESVGTSRSNGLK